MTERLDWNFNVYDVDNNGFIDKKELKQMITILHDMLNIKKDDAGSDPAKRADAIMAKLDTSGDKKLSREEFVQGVKEDPFLKKLLLGHELD